MWRVLNQISLLNFDLRCTGMVFSSFTPIHKCIGRNAMLYNTYLLLGNTMYTREFEKSLPIIGIDVSTKRINERFCLGFQYSFTRRRCFLFNICNMDIYIYSAVAKCRFIFSFNYSMQTRYWNNVLFFIRSNWVLSFLGRYTRENIEVHLKRFWGEKKKNFFLLSRIQWSFFEGRGENWIAIID